VPTGVAAGVAAGGPAATVTPLLAGHLVHVGVRPRSRRNLPRVIRIVVAEDNALLRDGIGRILSAEDDMEMVADCGSLDELLAAVDEHVPDVVVTDIRMPPTGTDEGIRAAAALRTTHPAVGVVVLSQFVSPQYALALLDQGSAARAYLLKDRVADVDDLVGAIRIVAKGGSVIDPQVVDELVKARSRADRTPLDHLTPREREVLGEMASGKSNAAIAATLVLSERAVEKHINSIFSKLHLAEEADANRRVKAVLLYLAASR
jgi:DNA-binding NarL/FixJ family response regulator